MRQLATALRALDWPNLVAGALLGAGLGFVVWILTRAYESWIASRELPYPISGVWFSAEFDPKGEAARIERNTFTQVKVRRALGGRFSARVVRRLADPGSRPATAWSFTGKLVHGDTLVGTWQSTVRDTKRFGAAVLKFTDYGRAVGYWIGPAGRDHPVYGYWIMSRQEEDARVLARRVLEASGFEFADVARYVLDQPPTNELSPKAVQQQHAADGARRRH